MFPGFPADFVLLLISYNLFFVAIIQAGIMIIVKHIKANRVLDVADFDRVFQVPFSPRLSFIAHVRHKFKTKLLCSLLKRVLKAPKPAFRYETRKNAQKAEW